MIVRDTASRGTPSVRPAAVTAALAVSVVGDLAAGFARGESEATDALRALHGQGAVSFVVFGAERFAPDGDQLGVGDASRRTLVEPGAVAAARHRVLPEWGFVLAATPEVDHPYNLARRVATVDHFTEGRGGVAVGVGSPPRERAVERVADAALVLRELWNSWPLASLVADRDRGVFARTDAVRRIEHRGLFSVDGPLNTPSSVQGEPVLAWWLTSNAGFDQELVSAGAVAEMLIVPPDRAEPVRRWLGGATAPLIFVRRGVGAVADTVAAPLSGAEGASGVLVELGSPEAARRLHGEIGRFAPALVGAGDHRGPGARARTLRERLGLAPRTIDLGDRPHALPPERRRS
ncbi:LLM class flavin-dependent oxidoreductase [Herbiconiux sp. 11R-BC]|uniref:hypothetical protein n=1 Tax=Herbiconiux sp. 11R-BC TaxID=3111637 RepID=UPI003C0AEFAC